MMSVSVSVSVRIFHPSATCRSSLRVDRTLSALLPPPSESPSVARAPSFELRLRTPATRRVRSPLLLTTSEKRGGPDHPPWSATFCASDAVRQGWKGGTLVREGGFAPVKFEIRTDVRGRLGARVELDAGCWMPLRPYAA
ncbi:hypothetical protein GSI_08638 [Ganoderma sinense ZZ0214-1]|uniref:Uncharacterized protein n=1 Tax=Ganoderma sinense ZZ0214-1 TaxID=1077348 RepID=A0A2G8S4E4_9APHY|nr:hypothetical protein GSI_08638 [Ganoderma sinense ZZ0214-1]